MSYLLLYLLVYLAGNNTASEHRMFERLMIEDITHWASHYKVRLTHGLSGLTAVQEPAVGWQPRIHMLHYTSYV